MSPRLRRFVADESGVALLEFSLVAMMMVVVVFGSINWARFFLVRSQLSEAIRDAARYGATLTESSTDSLAIVDYARTLMANATSSATSGTLAVSYAGTAGLDRRVRVSLSAFPFIRTTTIGMGAGRAIDVAAEFRRER